MTLHINMAATDQPPTAFQSRVYDVVRTIPKGKVRTYGSIAKGEERRFACILFVKKYHNHAMLIIYPVLYIYKNSRLRPVQLGLQWVKTPSHQLMYPDIVVSVAGCLHTICSERITQMLDASFMSILSYYCLSGSIRSNARWVLPQLGRRSTKSSKEEANVRGRRHQI